MAERTLEEGSVIGFKGGQARVEQIAFGDDHNIKSIRDLITTENLSNQSFSSVSINGATEFTRRRNSQPSDSEVVRQDKYRTVAAVNPGASRVNPLIFDAAANPFVRAESHQLS